MPLRPRAHVLEDQSIACLETLFASAGWTTDRLTKDYGEDLFVRVFNKGLATPYGFFVQAKATDDTSRYTIHNGTVISFPVPVNHVHHWTAFWEPVILTVWDSKADVTYWTCVQESVRDKQGAKPSRKEHRMECIHVSKANVIDSEGIKRLEGLTRRRFARFQEANEGAQVLVSMLEELLDTTIEYDPHAGVLVVAARDGGAKITFFGSAADDVERLARKLGLDIEATMHKAVALIADIVTALHEGASLIVRDGNCDKLLAGNLDEFNALSERERDLRYLRIEDGD